MLYHRTYVRFWVGSERFVHLDVRSAFSLKEGAFVPEHLAALAAEMGMPAVALTDRDGLYGAARFVAACEREGIRPILGASLTIRERGRDAPLVLLAQDERGLRQPLPADHRRAHAGGARRPLDHRDPGLRPRRRDGGARRPAFARGPARRPRSHRRGRRGLRPFREAFGPERLCASRPNIGWSARSDAEIRSMLRLADRAEVRAVATNPVRYLVPEDAFLADALECMREIVPIAANHVSRTNAEGWLKPAEAMRLLFAERPDLCDATLEIADSCRVRPRAEAGALPGLPDAGRAQRRRDPGRALLAPASTTAG